MKRSSSKSTRTVLQLLTPPTASTRLDERAPRHLTIRQLFHYKRYARLRSTATVIRVEGGHLLCVANLTRFGYDFYG